jgi:tol-pal system protein YbgF
LRVFFEAARRSDANRTMTKIIHPITAVFAATMALAIVQPPAKAAWWDFGSKGAPKGQAPVIEAQAEGAAERFNRIENQMRTLTGQVEELTFQLRQLQEQLKRMQQDNEFRFRELEGGGPAPVRSEAPQESLPPSDIATLPPPAAPPLPPQGESPDAIGAIAGEPPLPEAPDLSGTGAPPQPLGTLTLDAPPPTDLGDQPLDLTRPLPPLDAAPGPDLAAIQPSGDPRTDYERAYGSILSGDYDTAEAGFRQFLQAYPDSEYAPDAQYWLGESLFVRAQYREAANEFLAGYKAYPKSGKAPDALLKLGLSLAGLGEREAACSTFSAVLKQYPDASNALKQRIKVEQASAGC